MRLRSAIAALRGTTRSMARSLRSCAGSRCGIGALVFALVVAAAYLEKERIRAWIPPATTRAPLVWIANTFGGGVALVSFGVLLGVLGILAKRRSWVDTAMALAAGGVPCFVITKLGQFVLAEDRPSEGGAMHFFVAFGHGVSGHASAAALLFFPLSTILFATQRPRARVVLTSLLALWIALVAWTRMSLGMHYAWNVLLGIALGLWSGRAAATEVRSIQAERGSP